MPDKYIINKINSKKDFYLRIKACPNAAITKITGIMEDETIKVDLNAAPEKGKANQELIKFLAKNYKIKKSDISLISGAASRVKMIKIKNG